jgi:hypothetical protein
MICGCGSSVESARIELGFKICKSCAFSGPDVPRPKGRMVYVNGKVGAEIEILSARSWTENKKYFIPNGKGRSSVKNFSKNIAI